MSDIEDQHKEDQRPDKPCGDSDQGASSGPRIISSDLIFAGHREVWIDHGDEMYRLRVTSAGKLYLSK